MLGRAWLALLLSACPRAALPPPAPPAPPAVASHAAAEPAIEAAAADGAPGAVAVDFATQVQPILEARCRPCHFAGGKMYAKLPFDRPETIRRLGTRLFTRIQDPGEQRRITEFLEQKPEQKPEPNP